MRLSKILRKKPFYNNIIYFLISVLLLIISFKYPIFYLFLGLYLVFIVIKTKLLLPIIIILLVFLSRIFIDRIDTFNMMDNYDIYVNDVIDDKSYLAYYKNKKLLLYQNNHGYKPGDILNVTITFYDIEEKSYENDFDNEYYLKSKGIYRSGRVNKSSYIGSGPSINSSKYYYLNYLKEELSDDSYLYVRALVFGDNNLEGNVRDGYSILGLSHILAISGMHIILLFNILSFVLFKVFKYYRKTIPIVLVTIFVIIIGAPTSSVRAILFLIIGNLNKGRIRYSRLDILSISCLLMLIINPYLLYSTGFILSFLVSFILIFRDDLIDKRKLFNSHKIYILIFFITLPFVVNISNKISIMSFILSPILSIILGYVLVPISYLLALLPILDYLIKYIFIFMNIYIINLSELLPVFHYPSFNIYLMIIYYVLFGLFIYELYRGRGIYYIGLVFMYLMMIYGVKYIDSKGNITFIDCGQGDSALIELPYNKGIMVIDCFNSINYLKSKGIEYINYLVLTHSDNDHIGDYKEIIKEFKIGKIFYPKYDDRFDDLLKDYNNKYAINDLVDLNNDLFNIDIFGPINKYDDPNSNSIVLKIRIYKTSILFTGDMTIKEEEDLINKYKSKLNSDILKVGHHGSSTSSSDEFIKLVSPEISIISVSKNNNYGLPDNKIVNKLKKESKVYMTKDSGNINLYIKKEDYYIKPYR